MSCFIVPMAEAVAVSVIRRKNKSGKYKNLSTLEAMLWGGASVLALEHILHGELTPNLMEMGTAGVAMAVLVTAVWFVSGKKLGKVSAALLGTALMVAVDLVFPF